jgi:peptide/nickel transport system ATP-binding protein
MTALDDVSLEVRPGETLAVVGPSGSGKTTLARAVLRLITPDAGEIRFEGEDFLALGGAALRRRRARLQAVFQDPLAAFNPRATVGSTIADPLRVHRLAGRRARITAVAALLERVGLSPALAGRAVHEISGGQRQRVAIARAIALRPALVVLDEAVAALDVSVRRDILALLADLQRQDGMAISSSRTISASCAPSRIASPSWTAGGSSRRAMPGRSSARRNRRPGRRWSPRRPG